MATMRSFSRREKRSVVWWAPPIDSVTKGTGSHDLEGCCCGPAWSRLEDVKYLREVRRWSGAVMEGRAMIDKSSDGRERINGCILGVVACSNPPELELLRTT